MVTHRGEGRDDPRRQQGALTRRHWLAACGAAAVPLLAGCTGDGDDAGGEPTNTGDGGRTETDADGTETVTPTEPAETETKAGTGNDGVERFGEAVRFEESYAMEGTFEADGESGRLEARFDRDDVYWRIEANDRVTESYRVDGDHYLVFEDRCIKNPDWEVRPDGLDPDQPEEDAEARPGLEPEGTTTIDGERVLIYVITPEDDAGFEGETTYYVSAETGYPRRIEYDSGVIDLHSWGDVEPVSLPDMECESY